ncbi:MAG: 50S ribosomal protein L21, partial [Oscillospiraceae bacterium]
MKAVFITGGKQYAVCEGDVVYIEKLDAQADEVVTFEEVLFVGEGEEAKFGAPVVAGAKVEAKVVKNGKGK